MSNLFLTLMIAFVVIIFAIACLAIGWLITGKTKLEKGCGKDPAKKRDASCESDSSCFLCSSSENEHKDAKEIEPKSEKE